MRWNCPFDQPLPGGRTGGVECLSVGEERPITETRCLELTIVARDGGIEASAFLIDDARGCRTAVRLGDARLPHGRLLHDAERSLWHLDIPGLLHATFSPPAHDPADDAAHDAADDGGCSRQARRWPVLYARSPLPARLGFQGGGCELAGGWFEPPFDHGTGTETAAAQGE